MKKTKFSESRIVSIFKEAEAGMKVDDICHKHGISSATQPTTTGNQNMVAWSHLIL